MYSGGKLFVTHSNAQRGLTVRKPTVHVERVRHDGRPMVLRIWKALPTGESEPSVVSVPTMRNDRILINWRRTVDVSLEQLVSMHEPISSHRHYPVLPACNRKLKRCFSMPIPLKLVTGGSSGSRSSVSRG